VLLIPWGDEPTLSVVVEVGAAVPLPNVVLTVGAGAPILPALVAISNRAPVAVGRDTSMPEGRLPPPVVVSVETARVGLAEWMEFPVVLPAAVALARESLLFGMLDTSVSRDGDEFNNLSIELRTALSSEGLNADLRSTPLDSASSRALAVIPLV
jgi:hypothetical protein